MGKTEKDTFEVSEFGAFHNAKYKNYCEIVIYANGYIDYAIPSHIAKLEMIWGVDEEDLFTRNGTRLDLLNTIPVSASPMHWLCEDTNTVSCWYNCVVFPYNYTEEQVRVVRELIQSGCIDSAIDVEVAVEKTYEENRENIDFIEKLYTHKNKMRHKLYEELGD